MTEIHHQVVGGVFAVAKCHLALISACVGQLLEFKAASVTMTLFQLQPLVANGFALFGEGNLCPVARLGSSYPDVSAFVGHMSDDQSCHNRSSLILFAPLMTLV